VAGLGFGSASVRSYDIAYKNNPCIFLPKKKKQKAAEKKPRISAGLW
jgi:hypothetical protein